MNAYLILAAQLDALAAWIDDQLAGGAPPKWVAHVAAAAARYIAGIARLEGMVTR